MPHTVSIYRLNPVVAIEDFGERSLALHCEDLRLVELNATARDLVNRLDGEKTLEDIAAAMAADYQQPFEIIFEDMRVILGQMEQLGIVEPVEPDATADRTEAVERLS
ncbi:MAG: PqqD family protein [Anaerolineae bacterium]